MEFLIAGFESGDFGGEDEAEEPGADHVVVKGGGAV